MKKIFLLIVLINISGVFISAQKPNSSVKTAKQPANPAPIAQQISETDWKVLTDALQAEDWTKSAATAANYLQKLKTDNDKKQLAQLRYLRLFSLAGKILQVSGAKVPVNTDALWKELDDAASEFNGKEFLLPPHEYQNDCQKRVNYICSVTDNDRALRVTATNQEGTGIHSFDYIVFDDKNSLNTLSDGKLFLGGILKRIEYNQDDSKPWVMRLFYEKGFINPASK